MKIILPPWLNFFSYGLVELALYTMAKVPLLLLVYGSTFSFTVPVELAVNDCGVDHAESTPVKMDEPLL
jgi:hypothetical protein